MNPLNFIYSFIILCVLVISVLSHPVDNKNVNHRPMITVESEEGDGEYKESEEEEEIKLDHPWSCGTDAFSMLVAEGTIDKDCPDVKNDVNNCCFAHDNCYDEQLGREYCDKTFCNCLLEKTKGHKVCYTEDAPVFCNLVQEFGESAYIASGNSTLNATLIKSAEDTEALIHLTSISLGKNLTLEEYYD